MCPTQDLAEAIMQLQNKVENLGWENKQRKEVADEIKTWDLSFIQIPSEIKNWYPAYCGSSVAIYYHW
jgi:hypothetical protein